MSIGSSLIGRAAKGSARAISGLFGGGRDAAPAGGSSWQQGLAQNMGVLTGRQGAKPVSFAPQTPAPYSPAAWGQATGSQAARQPPAAPQPPPAAPQPPTPGNTSGVPGLAGMMAAGGGLYGASRLMQQSGVPLLQRGAPLVGRMSGLTGGARGGLAGLGAQYTLNAGLDLADRENWDRDAFNRATSVGAAGDNLLGYRGPGAKGFQAAGAALNSWNHPAQSARELGSASQELWQRRRLLQQDPLRFLRTWWDVQFG